MRSQSAPGMMTILKSGNRIVVDPTTSAVKQHLEPAFTFTTKRHLMTMDAREAAGVSPDTRILLETCDCFCQDHKNRFSTSAGFYDRIVQILTKLGYRTRLVDLDAEHRDAKKWTPYWDRIFDPRYRLTLRPGQDEFLAQAAARIDMGLPARFYCPPGYGKTFLIGLIGMLYPYLRIDVVTKRVTVLTQRIYPELAGMLPEVGICCGTRKRLGRRVMCFSADSLHHSQGDADILIVDEAHEAASDDFAEQLGVYDHSINLGLSGTFDMRPDGKSYREEAMFGPVVYKMSYQEAQDHGMVVPIQVIWTPVRMDRSPAEGLTHPVFRKKAALWRNDFRNGLVAMNSRLYGPDVQELIPTETIEHALALKKYLPDHELIYREEGISDSDYTYYVRHNLWPPGHKVMTLENRQLLTTLFERGKLNKAIVTTVWDVGVNFRKLSVVNRADGRGSPIADTQVPGRASRPLDDAALAAGGVKESATIHDYMDQFDKGCRQKACDRQKNYEANGWAQVLPTRVKGRRGRPADARDHQHVLFDD